jgi:hypothetical protein
MDKEVLLTKHFSNSLTTAEEKLFNELIETDSGFKEQYDFEQNLKHAIKDKKNQELKAKLVSFEEDIKEESPIMTSKGGFRNWSIAASIALLIGLGWMGYNSFLKTDYDDLYTANFQEYPNTVYTITRSDADESLEREAFVAYESGNYQKAITNFKELQVDGTKGYIDFYLAQSYLGIKNNSMAIKLFKKVIEERSGLEAEASWYMALAHLRGRDKANAAKVLEHHIKTYDYNKEKAVELLSELN